MSISLKNESIKQSQVGINLILNNWFSLRDLFKLQEVNDFDMALQLKQTKIIKDSYLNIEFLIIAFIKVLADIKFWYHSLSFWRQNLKLTLISSKMFKAVYVWNQKNSSVTDSLLSEDIHCLMLSSITINTHSCVTWKEPI